MLVIYKGQASCPPQNFNLKTASLWHHLMERSSNSDNPDECNNQGTKKMPLCNLSRIKFCICVLTPFVLSPLAFSSYKESRCGFVILLVTIFWMLEPVNISVTALLPVPLMPLLGILHAEEVAPNYMKEVLMMFLGGLGVAIAVQHCKLHERIALRVLLTLGSETKWLMLGLQLTTACLSMWISNTATTAMMVPIIEAVMEELTIEDAGKHEVERVHDLRTLHKALLLSVAYSANCGGTGTITGTSPNMVLYGYINEWYPESTDITYISWLMYNVPIVFLCVFSIWLVVQIIYVPFWRKETTETTKRIESVIRARYESLGRMTFHEAAVLSLFIVLVLLWITRKPQFIKGWSDVLPFDKKVGDAVPAIAILILMFLSPAEPWKLEKSPPLLNWKVLQEKMPWGLVLLLGGGYALADGVQKSGLSKWLGDKMSGLFFLPPAAVLTIMCIAITAMTEVMSNSAVTTIMVPILNQMAIASGSNPLYFMLPATLVTSYAFMLPVATGSNAIIYGTGMLKTIDMIKPGIILNIMATSMQLLMIHTYGAYLFNLNTLPSWANSTTTNNTNSSNATPAL